MWGDELCEHCGRIERDHTIGEIKTCAAIDRPEHYSPIQAYFDVSCSVCGKKLRDHRLADLAGCNPTLDAICIHCERPEREHTFEEWRVCRIWGGLQKCT